MSIDIYAAKLEDDGTYGPILDFKHAEPFMHIGSGEYENNPDYIPGVCMNMASSNWYELLKLIGLDHLDMGEQRLNEIRVACLTALEEKCDPYFVSRLIELANICALGMARGADRLIYI